MIKSSNKIRTKGAWLNFSGSHIPSSLELDTIVFKYLRYYYNILDIGCGFGKTDFELENRGYKRIIGVDLNPSGISNAKESNRKLGKDLHFKTGDAKKLSFNDGAFDFAITQAFWTTVTNIKERQKIANEINRVLKVGGMIYIADFSRTWNQTHYRKVYLEGVKKGLELGTFKAYDKKTGKFMYLAHHYTKHEFFKLLLESGFCSPIYYKSTIFTTQSGNKIKGCVMVSKKVIQI
jgi:ubiquinone/menaquinone biosynthesis C-methylase UbiE